MTNPSNEEPEVGGSESPPEIVKVRLGEGDDRVVGSLPSAAMLREYDELLGPGTAERLVRMAEAEAAHRRDIALRRERLQALTVLTALLLPLLSVVSGVVLVVRGEVDSSLVVVSLFGVGLAGFAFVAQAVRNRDERE